MSNFLGTSADLENFEPIVTTLAATWGSAGVQNVLNVSETGQLYSVAIGLLPTSAGTLAATLEIQVDGQTTQSIVLYSAGVLNLPVIYPFGINAGGGAGFSAILAFNARYASSLRIGLNITVTTSGTVYLGVTRGRRY